jgi:hypothetical protein
VIFFNILDISPYNVFVIWMAVNPDWNRGNLQRRVCAGQGIGKTSNPEEAKYPKDPSFCSHCEEDSGGGCWCPIRPTHRTNNSNTRSKCEYCCCMCVSDSPTLACCNYICEIPELKCSHHSRLQPVAKRRSAVMCVDPRRTGRNSTHLSNTFATHTQYNSVPRGV